MDKSNNFGTFRIVLSKINDKTPAGGAKVEAGDSGGVVSSVYTDSQGVATIRLGCPRYISSQRADAVGEPYRVYDVMVTLAGYTPVLFKGVQIFSGITTTQFYTMIKSSVNPHTKVFVWQTPTHKLNSPLPALKAGVPQPAVRAAAITANPVIVPENITVHLGPPNSDAENVTVPFIYYIKNVASSEIYPTWPEAALRANILAQITLALNRIYTEWYPSQGYDFDITSSTAYDQNFINGRAVFDSISAIVDEIFTNYVARAGSVAPVYTEYCDGFIAQCAGMSQWGTVELANQYYTPLDILRYYYGDDVYIKKAVVQESAPSSFPGDLKYGDESEDVALLQARLNRIAINYPAIPFVELSDGVFSRDTERAVRVFQQVFGLEPMGVVDEDTWYRVTFVYNAVKKLAELGSEGESVSNDGFPGRVLRVGDRGLDVLRMEYYLRRISEYLGSAVVPPPTVNGIFDVDGRPSVVGFQRYYGLEPTGEIDEATWNAIVKVYYDIPGDRTPSLIEYPGTPIGRGDRGQDVRFIQSVLNTIGEAIPEIPQLDVDGVFGARTEAAVRAFQSYFGLKADGVVGPLTWAKLNEEYSGQIGDVG